jgi:short-subunit dehydrogenase
MVDINLNGVILGSKLALERFLPHGRGHLVNIASWAGKAGLPGGATYCATKHAVVGLSEALRLELSDQVLARPNHVARAAYEVRMQATVAAHTPRAPEPAAPHRETDKEAA